MSDAEQQMTEARDDVVARLVTSEASTHPWARQTSRSLNPHT